MLDFLFNSLWGWFGLAGVVVVSCAAIAFIIPQSRPYMLAIAAGAVGAASIYAKGQRDRAALEQQRKDEAVRKAREAYDKIDARPDDVDSAARRMRDGSF